MLCPPRWRQHLLSRLTAVGLAPRQHQAAAQCSITCQARTNTAANLIQLSEREGSCRGLVTVRRGRQAMHRRTLFPMQPISLCARPQGRPSSCLAACRGASDQLPAAHQTRLRGSHVATHGSSTLEKGRHAAGLAHALPTVLQMPSAWQADSSGA